jgi:hypothetical protein
MFVCLKNKYIHVPTKVFHLCQRLIVLFFKCTKLYVITKNRLVVNIMPIVVV